MKIIVDKDIKKVNIIIDDASSSEEKELHIEQDGDLVLINIEEIIQEEAT